MLLTHNATYDHLPASLSHDAQIFFLWLASSADEAGHVTIHPGELERAMDASSEHLETVLRELVAHGGLLLSQAGNHRSHHLLAGVAGLARAPSSHIVVGSIATQNDRLVSNLSAPCTGLNGGNQIHGQK